MRLRVDGGAISDQIVRIRNGALEPLWSSRESRPVILGYDAGAATGVLTVGNTDLPRRQTFVRTYDGAQLSVTGPCQLFGANRDVVLTLCTTDTLVGNRYLQYLAAYRWHGAIPR